MDEVLQLKMEGRFLEALESLAKYVIDKYRDKERFIISTVSDIEGIKSNELAEIYLNEFIEKINKD